MITRRILLTAGAAGVVSLSLSLSAGCGAALAQTAPMRAYSFGVLPQRSALLTAQYWNPILEDVSQRSGVKLVLKTARTAPEFNESTENGEYDFVYSNTIFLPKMAPANYQVILRPKTDAITGQIVTLAQSPIHAVQDLAGRTVGFPSLAAFVGYAVPMDHLLRQGVTVTPVFGGNQEGVMAQLKAGRVIAAGVNNQVMRAFATRENIAYRVLWESAPFHNLPIAALPQTPPEAIAAVRRAFAAMEDHPEGAKIFAESGRLIGQDPPYGFTPATNADYAAYTAFYATTLVKDVK